MTARELMNTPSDETPNEEPLSESDYLHESKLSETHLPWDEYAHAHGRINDVFKGEPNLYSSIKKHGIVNPVSLRLQKTDTGYEPYLTNGHHRTAVAHDIDPDMPIPVSYTDYFFGS